LKRTKSDYSTPIIASMHGASTGAWLDFAVEIQDCGAGALELNWQVEDAILMSQVNRVRRACWNGFLRFDPG